MLTLSVHWFPIMLMHILGLHTPEYQKSTRALNVRALTLACLCVRAHAGSLDRTHAQREGARGALALSAQWALASACGEHRTAPGPGTPGTPASCGLLGRESDRAARTSTPTAVGSLANLIGLPLRHPCSRRWIALSIKKNSQQARGRPRKTNLRLPPAAGGTPKSYPPDPH